MNKTDVINDMTVALSTVFGNENLETVKAILTVKLMNYDLTEIKQLPSTEVKTNEYILKRYVIDMSAKGLKESTIKAYMCIIRKFFDAIDMNYADVTGEIITNYIAYIRVTPNKNGDLNSKSAIRNAYIMLKGFFDWAYRKHHIEVDVMRDVDRVPSPGHKKDCLTADEIGQIKELDLDARERALFELMISTGMRVGEIRNLKISDVNLAERTIKIESGKTDNARRNVYLSVSARNSLANYIGDRKQGYVFTTKRGMEHDKPCTTKVLENIATSLGREAVCHLDTTVHVFRKTFASMMYEKSGDMKMVSKLLGHASTTVTELCYVVDNESNIKHMALKLA